MQGINVLTFTVTGATYGDIVDEADDLVTRFFDGAKPPAGHTREVKVSPALEERNGSGDLVGLRWEADVTLAWYDA